MHSAPASTLARPSPSGGRTRPTETATQIPAEAGHPSASPLVRATMRGIRRAHGAAQHQAKLLLREDLFVVMSAMGDRLKDLPDRALLLIGFAMPAKPQKCAR